MASRRKSLTRCGKKPVKEATVNRDIAQLKNLFEEAAVNGKIPDNPAKYVKFLKENNARKRVLSQEEFDKLLANASEHIKGLILVAYHTGMRQGEILFLTWDKVDLKRKIILLNPTDTKTNEPRIVPLNETLMNLFTELNRVRHIDHNCVFIYKGKPIVSLHSSFKTACLRSGIQDFHFHDLRHCFNTRDRKAGIQDHVIMKITGHKTREMFERYDTVDDEDIHNAMLKLEKKCIETATPENSEIEEMRKPLILQVGVRGFEPPTT